MPTTYPPEIFPEGYDDPWGVAEIIINNTVSNVNALALAAIANAEANINFWAPDNVFMPVNNNVFSPTFTPSNINEIDGDEFNWPDFIAPVDIGGITINTDGSVDGGEDWPDGKPKIVSIKQKLLYSSIVADKKWLGEFARLIMTIEKDGSGEYGINHIKFGRYLNRFALHYVRLFTYGEKEELTDGEDYNPNDTFINDRGTGGHLGEMFKTLFSQPDANTKWPLSSGATKTNLGNHFYASILETNIKKTAIANFTVNTPCTQTAGCSPLTPVPIKERGIANGKNVGFSIKRIFAQIHAFDPEAGILNYILTRFFLMSILRIERLRTDYYSFQQFWHEECCEGGNDGNFAIENIRHQVIWQPLFDIPVARIYSNPLFVDKNNYTESLSEFSWGDQNWEQSAGTDNYSLKQYCMRATIDEGYKFLYPLFLAPGSIWRARIIFDPRSILWLIGKLITSFPTSDIAQLPVVFPDFRFRLNLEGLKIVYDYEEEEK